MSQAYRVLIVDDEPIIRTLVTETLSSDKVAVLAAENGAEGIKRLSVHRIDLVILDWLMPVVSGLDMLARMRVNASTRKIPVLMLTSKATSGDALLARMCGADAFLAKPFSPLALIEKVQSLLVTGRGEGDTEQLPAPSVQTDSGRLVE